MGKALALAAQIWDCTNKAQASVFFISPKRLARRIIDINFELRAAAKSHLGFPLDLKPGSSADGGL